MMIAIIGALVLQGFQCSSREMTTAKVAFQSKDYDKAIDFAQQELTKNPQNEEAYLLMADIYLMKGNVKKAAEFAVKADQLPKKDTKLSQRPKLLLNKIWVESYNSGVDNLNRYFSTQNAKFLDSAINYFETGKIVRPEMTDFYAFIGQAYELRGDTTLALSEYIDYYNKSKKDFDYLINNKFYINQNRRDVLTALGKPKLTTGISGSQGDSLLTDLFQVADKDLYLFYKDNKKDLNFKLVGLRYDPPQNWLPNEQSQWSALNTTPIGALAQIYYYKQKYQDALTYVKLLGSLEPENTNINAFLVQIYQDQGKMDDAFAYLQQLIKENPTNKLFIGQLGDLYQTQKEYTKAIEAYLKALEIDPTYELAIRNIASSYKNRASIKQGEIKAKMDTDKNYKPDFEEFFPDLRESAKYFEKAIKTPKYKDDFAVISDLVNIYYVLDDKAKMNNYIESLEKLETKIPENQKEYYYLELVKIFSSYVKDDAKRDFYSKKIKQ